MTAASSIPVFVAALAVAIGGRASAQDPEKVRAAIGQSQRELQQVRAEAETLLDARIRYDLGLPLSGELDVFRGAAPATAPAMERAQAQLAEEESATSTLQSRFERIRQQVEQLHSEAAQRARLLHKEDEWITVPVPGSGDPKGSVTAPPAAVPRLPLLDTPSSPAGESRGPSSVATGATPVRMISNLDPIKAQINGSTDSGLVAQGLFKAAQSLMDRAAELRAQGLATVADQADEEARQRLLRAVEELKPVTSGKTPEFADLFHLGKCRELLFRIAERRDNLSLRTDVREYQRREQEVKDPFVAITVRDVVSKNGSDQLGSWGRAAQAALDHFRWMNLHASYVPKTDLNSITWTGQTQR